MIMSHQIHKEGTMDTNDRPARFERIVREIAASVEVVMSSNLPPDALHFQNGLGALYPSIACKMHTEQ